MIALLVVASLGASWVARPAATGACAFATPTVDTTYGMTPADTGARQVFDPDSYGGTDSAKLAAALSAADAVDGAVVMHRFYTTTPGTNLFIGDGTMITGGGIRRGVSPQQTLTQAAIASDTCVHVADASGYSTGVNIGVFTSAAVNGQACSWTVSSKTATTVCGSGALGCTASIGAVLAHVDSALLAVSPTTVTNVIVDSVAFDGNNTQNAYTHDWTLNNTLAIRGTNTVRNSYFYDTPSENLTICGGTVTSNTAWNLQGSFIHKSCSSLGIFDTITYNDVNGANLTGDAIMGHSEGLITLSNDAGSQNLSHNKFMNGNQGVFGNAAADDQDIHSLYDCYSGFRWLISIYDATADVTTFSFDATMENMPTAAYMGLLP